MKYLVQFNNGHEADENTLTKTKGFNTLDEAKKYAKAECEVYYNILDGNFSLNDEGFYEGSGTAVLSNCKDTSYTWFYAWTADFCEVENL